MSGLSFFLCQFHEINETSKGIWFITFLGVVLLIRCKRMTEMEYVLFLDGKEYFYCNGIRGTGLC